MNKIVIHIESGLGNQMLSYCEYLAIKKANPESLLYIENVVYDIPECNKIINQWNGYELENIFGIKVPNIKECYNQEEWNSILKDIYQSKFWEKNWNFPVHITNALNNSGLHLKNIRGDYETKGSITNINMQKKRKPNLKSRFRSSLLGNFLLRMYYKHNEQKIIKRHHKNLFIKYNEDIYTGHFLCLKYRGNGIEKIENEIKNSFKFPQLNGKNLEFVNSIKQLNAVAIHARRGDMLGSNGYCYKYGYFKRAVTYIKKHVENPVFIFFTDPGSIEWCKENEKIFALNFKKDKVLFVDWNKGENSYRDMQLISYCKHAIITNSTFGWFGSYFINNPNKITISPIEVIEINTTHHL